MSEFDKFMGCVKKTLTFDLEKECISYLISKGLSIAIVLLSFTSKLPQILYMIKTKEIKGLSYISIYFDILSTLFYTMYPFHMGYAFLTYGEGLILLFQNILIFFICWKYDTYQSSDRNNMSFSLLLVSFLFLCYKGLFDDKIWKIIGSGSTILSMGSRITQIIASYKAKSTGPLSTITYGLNMLGNAARIFTSLKETQDIIMVGGFVVSLLLNLIIFLQIIYYNKKSEPKKDFIVKEEKVEKKEEKEKNDKKKKNKKVE
jgi:mannose-P-dolichol utilization defect protein 1